MPQGACPKLTGGIEDAVVLADGALAVFSSDKGNIPLREGTAMGIYYHDSRFVSGYELRMNGYPLEALGVAYDDGKEAVFHLSHFPFTTPEGTDLDKLAVGLEWKRRVDGAAGELREEVLLRSYVEENVTIPLHFRFECRFCDTIQVRGLFPDVAGKHHEPGWEAGELHFVYDALDGVRRRTRIRFSEPPHEQRADGADFELVLPGQGERRLELRLSFEESGGGIETDRSRQSPPARAEMSDLTSSSDRIRRLLNRSFADVERLRRRHDDLPYYAAGLPWFSSLIGRDAMTTALMMLPYETTTSASTLRLLARFQGKMDNKTRNEEPGRIMHEFRASELARAGLMKNVPNYGAVDNNAIFLILLNHYVRWTGDLRLVEELAPCLGSILEWIDRRLEMSDGWIAYPVGMDDEEKHSAWKDVEGAVVREDGQPTQGALALAEVQALLYFGWRCVAELYRWTGEEGAAEKLGSRADKFREQFRASFWDEREGRLAMALEQGYGPIKLTVSNLARVFSSGILPREDCERVADRLLEEDSFSGWGVRTMSSREATYCPFGYHNGGVWPHDNALIVFGMARQGLNEHASRICDGLIEAAFHFPHLRLPEVFCGYPRAGHTSPAKFTTACQPQAWAAASVPFMLSCAMGLRPDALREKLVIDRPWLPPAVPDLQLRGLRVGGATLDLSFCRSRSGLEVQLDSLKGECRVSHIDDDGKENSLWPTSK